MVVSAQRGKAEKAGGGGRGGDVVVGGSAAGCCPGHTTCLTDVPCPAVAPGLRAGSSTLVQAQPECCGNVCVSVEKVWLTGGRQFPCGRFSP